MSLQHFGRTTLLAAVVMGAASHAAHAQMMPPAQWAGPGYTLVPMVKAATPEAEAAAYRHLKAAGLQRVFDRDASATRPDSGVYGGALGDIVIVQVDSGLTCSANQCKWLIFKSNKLVNQIDACDVIDYVAISTDHRHIKICDTKIELK